MNQHIKRIAIICLACIAITMIYFSKTNKNGYNIISTGIVQTFNPIVTITYMPIKFTTSSFYLINEILNLYNDNTKLRVENKKLQEILIKQKIDIDVMKNTFHVASMNAFIHQRHIEARILYVSYGVSNFAILDTGNLDIPEYSAVLCNGGLAGRVVSSTNGRTRVMLINNEYSYIPIFVTSTGTRGVLSGTGNGVKISVLYNTAKPNLGDIVVTSSRNDLFPVDIPVGIVSKIDDNGIEVKRFCDLDRLSSATIIL